MEIINIKTEYITLGQLIKFIGLINNGGDAKNFILKNEILINGLKEEKRGKKLYNDNKISINKVDYLIKKG